MTSYCLRDTLTVTTATAPASPDQLASVCWAHLADLSLWEQWLPRGTVTLLDPGDWGRGSRLLVQHRHVVEQWEVSYWEPGNRIVMQIDDGAALRACKITLESQASSTLLLIVTWEIQLLGWRRLVAPLWNRLYAHRCTGLARALCTWLQTLPPDQENHNI